MHICINVNGGLQYSAKRGFALRIIGFGLFVFSSLNPNTCDLYTSCLQCWQDNEYKPGKNVSCDLMNRCTKPVVTEKFLFSHFPHSVP